MLLDTYVWAWMLTNDPKLTRAAIRMAEATDAVRLSPISFFEISQNARLGKRPEMGPFLTQLPGLTTGQGVLSGPLTAEIAVLAGEMDWSHRDPFDRIIAAISLYGDQML
ncbi:type II toxin-antitoxin system VapC family toxin [Gymnodinialimonas sp. 2305UL16-5]|uniref:type II toxin-antitoxin system VapC family toxin n=1 Tax=Gymnodinialimonas mytili TaxID=3126503 RepID=UPI0030A9887E